MGRPRVSDAQITIRLPAETLSRLDQLADTLSPPGISVSRADALRAALEAGLRVYEAGPQPPGAKKKARNRKP